MPSTRFWLASTAALAILAAQTGPDAEWLRTEQALAVQLGGGAKRSVRIEAAAGDYLRIDVQADGEMAVKTSLFDGAGKLVAVTPSLGGTGGLAHIAAYTENAGVFRLELASPMFRPEPHTSTVTLVARHPATAGERLDAEGHREFARVAVLANSGPDGMRQAIAELDRPIELAHGANDPVLEMRATFGQGQFLGTLGEQSGARENFEKSLPIFERCLEMCRRFGDVRAEAHVMSSIGQSYDNLERHGDAASWYGKALELHRSSHQAWETALTLNNLANAEAALGRLDLALDHLREQEIIRQELKDELGLNQMRVSLGDTYLSLGDSEHALEALAATLPHWGALDDPQTEADAYGKLGLAYMAAGEYDSSSAALEKATTLGRKLKNAKIMSGDLILLAQLAGLRHDPEGARRTYTQALAAAREAGYRRDEALALTGLAELEIAAAKPQAALAGLEQALGIATELAAPYDEANIRRAIGKADFGLGDCEAASRQFGGALEIERRLGDRFGEVQTLYDLAALDEKQGNGQRSLVRLNEAMNVIDSTRSSLAEPGLRAAYLASQRSVYEQAASLLVRMSAGDAAADYGARAFAVSERAHARALLDVLGKTPDEVGGADAALRAQARALDSALHAAAVKHEERHITELLAERNQIELRLRQEAGSEAAPQAVTPLTLPAIRQSLMSGGNTVLLEYLTGREQSHLWMVTGSELRHYDLPGEDKLEAAVRALYGSLTERNRLPEGQVDAQARQRVSDADGRVEAQAAELSRVLLPMPAPLLAGRALIVVVDGPLQLTPFALLPAPGSSGKTLGESNALTMAPSASVLTRMRGSAMSTAATRLLVVADPVYSASDPRVESVGRGSGAASREAYAPLLRSASDFEGQEFGRLRMSGTEAREIEKLAPPGQVTALSGFDAVPAAFRRSDIRRYSIVHVAAHALLDNRHPELSGLVLSLVDRQGRKQDGFLRLFDIYEMRLQARLVVLSACETSIGREMRGEGMMGLARGFLTAGSRRVLSSLWKVDDRATAEFMRQFYSALLRRHLTAAAALASAQQAMRLDPAWRSPYYWAPFVLQGDF